MGRFGVESRRRESTPRRQELKETLIDEIIVADHAGFQESSSTGLLPLFRWDERRDE